MAKTHVTFNVEAEIKKQFNLECLEHDLNMSETIQNMMINFVSASKKMRQDLNESSNNYAKEVIVFDSTRLNEDV